MSTVTRVTDRKARVSLPASFANATVILEIVSETEVRIRKAQVIAEDDLHFVEGEAIVLTDADRDAFLDALDNPPPPNAVLKKAARKHRKQ